MLMSTCKRAQHYWVMCSRVGLNKAHHILRDEGILLAARDEDAFVPVSLDAHFAAALHAAAAALRDAASAPAAPAATARRTAATATSATAEAATWVARSMHDQPM